MRAPCRCNAVPRVRCAKSAVCERGELVAAPGRRLHGRYASHTFRSDKPLVKLLKQTNEVPHHMNLEPAVKREGTPKWQVTGVNVRRVNGEGDIKTLNRLAAGGLVHGI